MVFFVVAVSYPALWHGWDIVLGLPGAGFGTLLIGRQLRALECLAHEASHYNWNRRNRRANNLLAVALACVPTGVRLEAYRESHLKHHGRFGTSSDPDRNNYELLGIESLDRSHALAFALDALNKMAAYRRQWSYNALGSGKLRALPTVWASVMIILPASLVAWGLWPALVGACIWVLGYYVMLPIIRFLGESSEHIYIGQSTVFDATITNLGLVQRIIIHPHGDGYHTIHHLWPGVPHHQIRGLHSRLLSSDQDGYAKRLRCRSRFLSSPRCGIATR